MSAQHPQRSLPRHHAPALVRAAAAGPSEALLQLDSSAAGITSAEAARRLAEHGPNALRPRSRVARFVLLARAVRNPLVVLLMILAASSFVAGDAATAGLMAVMMTVGVGIRFVQELRAATTVSRLRGLVHVHATVMRDGRAAEVPIEELVPGDVVRLAAGDMVPADIRLLSSKDLLVTESLLTGESFPVEKSAVATGPGDGGPLGLPVLCFLGTSVQSGTAEGVVVETGRRTILGGVAESLEAPEPPTAFETGTRRFTWFMVALVAVMAPVVFLVNGLARGNWHDALFFALAAAVGLTPEMLPTIVAVCATRGALRMADRKVVVTHVDSIQNLGAMDVLCTDKTGTLTLDRILLERHCDVLLRDDVGVLGLAWLTSHHQTGLRNLLDQAILEHGGRHAPLGVEQFTKVDEVPFDFTRRVMSVVVEAPDGRRRLVAKGSPDAVFSRCVAYEVDGAEHAVDGRMPGAIVAACDRLSAEGFRVLAVASRDLSSAGPYSRGDERDLMLHGFVAFLDPPKDSARAALEALATCGVSVKVVTGDGELVTRAIAAAVGIDPDRVLTGAAVEGLDDASLARAVRDATLLVRLDPGQKRRVVRALQRAGHVVGFLGDGVNDAPALRQADVGITVDSAVDVARESADCILLDKDLRVLRDGVEEGRRVFVNVLKYIRMGASSNFGNMLSVLAASCVLPYLPMTPLQILAGNLLYDCSQLPIPTDDVDPEQVARPRPWTIGQVSRFILLVGPCSSIFDATTFAVLLYVFGCVDPARAPVFHAGWFVESLVTQTLVIHVIRTNRIPVLRSSASLPLTVATVGVAACGAWLPGSPFGAALGFAPLPPGFWPFLAATVTAYAAVTFAVKHWLVARRWIS